jgi:hypothetical protein
VKLPYLLQNKRKVFDTDKIKLFVLRTKFCHTCPSVQAGIAQINTDNTMLTMNFLYAAIKVDSWYVVKVSDTTMMT